VLVTADFGGFVPLPKRIQHGFELCSSQPDIIATVDLPQVEEKGLSLL
jgi:hypothetical protein